MSLPSPRRRSQTVAAAVAAVALSLSLFGVALGACSSNEAQPINGSGNTTTDTCAASPAPGCKCSPAGSSRACGVVIFRDTDYVSCAEGTMSCGGDGNWGECVATKLTSRDLTGSSRLGAQSGGIHVLDLGTDAGTCNNPCDPTCAGYTDNPTGLDAGVDGLAVIDGGLTTLATDAPPPVACSGLSMSPTPQTITVTQISPVSPSQLQFNVALTPTACYFGAPPALWQIDRNDVATIDGTGKLTVISPIATTVNVSAYSGSYTATGVANIVVAATDTSSAPGGVTASQLNGAGSGSDGLTIIYPYDSTVLPLALAPPIFQWSKTSTNTATAIKVTLRYPANGSQFSYATILPELQTQPTGISPGSPRAFISPAVWSLFEQTAKGNDAYVAIQRLEGTSTLFPEKTVKLHFATGQLKGTVLYQSYGTKLVTNYSQSGTTTNVSFGAATLQIQPGATNPTIAAGTNSMSPNGDGCRVCHSVSSNGNRLVTQRFTGGNVVSALYDFTNNTVDQLFASTTGSPNDGRYAWPALSPDGSKLFGDGSNMSGANSSILSNLYSVPAGAALTTSGMPSNLQAACPVFSPDGRHIAFNFFGGTSQLSSKSADGASLGVIDFNPTGNVFSNGKLVATPGSNVTGNKGLAAKPSSGSNISGKVAWPSFFPTNDKIAYEYELYGNARDAFATRSQCDCSTAQNSEGVHAELWWVDVASGTSARLNQANGMTSTNTIYLPPHASYTKSSSYGNGGDETMNYEPTMNPQQTGGYSWMVFTSRRAYGNIATVNPYWSDPRWQDLSTQPTPKKLWVSAIDATPTVATDPSHPAFYLPGQELIAGNSKAYYVLQACTPGATSAYGIANGGFETNGLAAWSTTGTAQTNTVVHGGSYSAQVGSTLPSNTSTLSQTFNVPTTGTTTLSMWLRIACTDSSIIYDWTTVTLTDNTAGGTTVLLPKTCSNTSTWQQVTSGTLPAGHSITLTVTQQDDFYPTDPSYALVDDVQLITGGSTLAAGGGPCQSNLDCCTGSTCTLDPPPLLNPPVRHCLTPPTGGCVADGVACSTDSQCCSFPSSRCSQQTGTCTVVPPPPVFKEVDYTRDYTWQCPANQSVVWRLFNYQTLTPYDSSVIFGASTSLTQAGLATAAVTTFDTSNAARNTASDDVGLALKNGGTSSQLWLRITMRLMPSSDAHSTPSILSWGQQFDCVDSQ